MTTNTTAHVPPRSPAAALVLLALLAGVAASAATPPALVGYQGVLRTASGQPLDGTYDMIFRFTDTPVGGTLLLTDYHTGPDGVVITGGLFSTLLGGGTLAPGTESSLQSVFANHAPVYVEVQVGAETLSPRVQVVSTAYALNAGRLGGQLPGNYVDTGFAPQSKMGQLTSETGLVGLASGSASAVVGTTSTGTAIYGEASSSSGASRGVQGVSNSEIGVGVLGSAFADAGATEGVRGQSTSPDGKGVVGGAFSVTGANYGVYGESQSPDGTGVYGRVTATSGQTTGVGGETYSSLGTGVAGVAHASGGDAWGVYGATTSPDGYGVVSDGDSVTAGDIYATGAKYFLAEHPAHPDQAIFYACLEGGETGVYQRGSARLVDGVARVALPDPFPLVAAGRITVQVTPVEPCAGLYVPRDEVGRGGFTVRELGDGRSDAEFSYLVMAERAGFEDAPAVRSISVADKILTSTRLDPGQKAMLRSTLATTPVRGMSPEDRTELFTAIQAGDLDESCRLLGGCSSDAGSGSVDLGLHDPAATHSTADRAIAGSAPATPIPVDGAGDAAVDRRDERQDEAAVPGREAARGDTGGEPRPGAAARWSLVEPHPVGEPVESGDVLVIDRTGEPGALRPGTEAADPAVVGVVAPVDGRVPRGEQAPVAVAGTVPCKVDAGYGAIAPGDLLVVSPTLGHAMRASDPAPGTVVGKALEALDWGRGTIRVLVTLR